MTRILLLTAVMTMSATVQAQSGLPRVGSKLPDVEAWNAEGEPFSLAELRGEYSVLVFGCLT